MITRRAFTIGAAVVVAAFNHESGRRVIGSITPPLVTPSGAWQIQHSAGVQLGASGNGFMFDFPAAPGSVHYITQEVNRSIRGTMSASVSLAGDPQYLTAMHDGKPEPTPSTVGLYFQRVGDNLSGQGEFSQYRWWSRLRIRLVSGIYEISVPLVREEWTSVYGAGDDVGFENARNLCHRVGLTFGGSFYGHGVQGGGLRFYCSDFRVG